MTERMTDEALGRAIREQTLMNFTSQDDPESEEREYEKTLGAAARRLVHEDDLRVRGAEAEFCQHLLGIAALDEEEPGYKLIHVADELRHAAYALARLIAERDAAFQDGAEAMREALRVRAIEKAEWFEERGRHDHGDGIRQFIPDIKHEPIPDHQSAIRHTRKDTQQRLPGNLR